jgi:hypothetical protein
VGNTGVPHRSIIQTHSIRVIGTVRDVSALGCLAIIAACLSLSINPTKGTDMTVVRLVGYGWGVVADGYVLASGFTSNEEAWRWIDRRNHDREDREARIRE